MSSKTRKDLEREYYDRSTENGLASPHAAAEHHALHADENTPGYLYPISFDGVPQVSWIPVGGMVWAELRARAIGQPQSIEVQGRYHPNGETIQLVDPTTDGDLAAGGGWNQFLDGVDDTIRAAVGLSEIRVRGRDDGDGTGTLEVEGGIT